MTRNISKNLQVKIWQEILLTTYKLKYDKKYFFHHKKSFADTKKTRWQEITLLIQNIIDEEKYNIVIDIKD